MKQHVLSAAHEYTGHETHKQNYAMGSRLAKINDSLARSKTLYKQILTSVAAASKYIIMQTQDYPNSTVCSE